MHSVQAGGVREFKREGGRLQREGGKGTHKPNGSAFALTLHLQHTVIQFEGHS